jgi:hypothetical protein
MKKTLSIILLLTMLACAFAVNTAAADGDLLPSLLITGISANQSAKSSADGSPVGKTIAGVWDATTENNGADMFEFISIKNTTDKAIDLYDGYAIGYNGSAVTGAKFRHQVTETTLLAKGTDWVDGSEMDKTKVPVNPDTALLQPGKTAFIWFYSGDTYNANGINNIQQFRDFWDLADDVIVITIDANTGAGGNFNIKNSATGTYMICNFKGSSIGAFAADKVLAPNADQVNYTVDAGIDTLAEVICYITVNFDTYDNAKKVKNANNVIYIPVQNAASAKWYEATDDTVVCQVADELRKKAETTAPETSAPETPKNPGTGDAASIFVAVAVIALAGVAVVAKKKR